MQRLLALLTVMGLVLWAGQLASASTLPTGTEIRSWIRGWKPLFIEQSTPVIAASAYEAALSGGIQKGIVTVPNVAAAKGWGVGVFDIPIGQLWKAIADETAAVGYLPVKKSVVVQGAPRTNDHVIFQSMDVPMFSDRWWMVRILYNRKLYRSTSGKAWELAWRDEMKNPVLREKVKSLADGDTPVAWTRGDWLLVDLGENRTLVQYYVWTDPGGSVPTGLATRFSAGRVDETISAVARMAREFIPSVKAPFEKPDGSRF